MVYSGAPVLGKVSVWDTPELSRLQTSVLHHTSDIPNPGSTSRSGEELRMTRLSLFHSDQDLSSTSDDSSEVLQSLQQRLKVHSDVKPVLETDKESADRKAIGGLRGAYRSVLRTPGHQVWGPKVRGEIEEWCLDKHSLRERIIKSVEDTTYENPPTSDDVNELRDSIITTFTNSLKSQGTPYTEDCTLKADFVAAWTNVSHDAATLTTHYYWEGAPANIEESQELGHLFPTEVEQDPEPVSELHTDFSTFRNYEGLGEDDDAYRELTALS